MQVEMDVHTLCVRGRKVTLKRPHSPGRPFCLCGRKAPLKKGDRTELRSCEKVEVAVLGSLSLMVSTVSVDVKQY